MSGAKERERRVLVLAPNEKDASLCRRILAEAGLPCLLCPDLAAVGAELSRGAGAALVTEQSLNSVLFPGFLATLERQPAWSDFPIVVLAAGGAASAVETPALSRLGNVVLLDQPVRIPVLVSALRMALRSRERQYEVRDLLGVREASAAALKEADRRKDEFLAVLAHELRNPLSAIGNAAQLLGRPDLPPDKIAWSAALVGRQVGHMSRLVADLLDVSRIRRGTLQLQRERLDLRSVAKAAVEVARPQIEARRHQLRSSLGDVPLWVEGDQTRLAQVILNLLVNAAKFTPEGGQIELRAGAEDATAVLAVRDTGRGMTPAQLDRIFDLFAQVDEEKDRAQGGLGIGLTLVRRLVELHGGSVAAWSDGPGQGSEFTVRLPLLPPEP